MNFRRINNIAGWITGGIATLVYLMTMERTVSFWDCGEFLSCAYKLEVGHSPGAPLFMMLQRMFGILAGGNKAHAAIMINSWSALMSGGTILFLFWSITHMARKLVVMRNRRDNGGVLLADTDDGLTSRQVAGIIGAGLVGALAYTFSDTFWFSAVEAEVYATSSFFTAITFWAILKWENIADNRYADRWLVLIMYLMGLSIGIHLLNLLTIPTIAMVYYFRRYKATPTGTAAAFLIGCVLLGLVQFGVIQGLPVLAGKFDRLFVNNFNLPFFSGAIFFLVLLAALIAIALHLLHKRGYYMAHMGVLCFMFVIIGFSSYIVPVIRSKADTPIDMTDPANIPNLVSYVEREQFGAQPILTGPYYTDRPTEFISTGDKLAPTQRNGKDYYEVVGQKQDLKYENTHFFPRIYENQQPEHVSFYKEYLGLGDGDEPTSADNYKFFVGYQMDWMWWRYFMWNYVGRQNDFEGQGEAKNGNWTSGMPALDKILSLGSHDIGDTNKMGDGYRNNGARNELYYLPFILGILGLIYQFNRSKRQGIVVLTLFFFTGIAIGIYLNMPPLQPRERDYAYAGATYAFAIWIGLGVLMLDQWFSRAMKGSGSAYAATALSLLCVPALMAAKEWNDHDRSHKSLARASAVNTLNSCDKNAVLFTFGDNDTYPLWYAQEVEGIRPDIRIINTSLLGIDWYIDQLNYKINEADAVPMIWKRDDYLGDRRNYLRLVTHAMYPQAVDIPEATFIPLDQVLKFTLSKENQLPIGDAGDGEMVNYFPTKNFFVPGLSKAALMQNGMLKDSANIETDLRFSVGKSTLVKDDIAVLNIVAANAATGWKRPIYFGGGLGDNYQGMQDYLKMEGTVFRLMPYKPVANPMKPKSPQDIGFVDIDKSLDLFTRAYTYGGAETQSVYFDEKNRQMFMQYRINASRIADELTFAGRKADAIRVLDKVRAGITEHAYQYDYTAFFMAGAYFRAGGLQQARDMTKKLEKNAVDDVSWILSLSESSRQSMVQDAQRDISIMNALAASAKDAGDSTTSKELDGQVKQQTDRIVKNVDLEGLQRQ